jgi:hypothetical protein
LAGDPLNTFAVMNRADEWGEGPQVSGSIENFGATDPGIVWISGEITDRTLNAGDVINIQGNLKVFSANIPDIDLNNLNPRGRIVLERIFDAQGHQEFSNPVFMSHTLTPTGLPLERKGANSAPGTNHGVYIGDIVFGQLAESDTRSLEGTWQAELTLPDYLPDGVYSVVIDAFVEGTESDTLHFENVYAKIFDTPFTTTHATLITIGTPAPRRLSWVLGLNNVSNGARGTIALEDRGQFEIAGRVTTNSKPFFIPMSDDESGYQHTYTLEPYAPLIGAGNRGWISTPTVPLSFPSGQLKATIKQPDGSLRKLGSAPFTQPFIQSALSRIGWFLADSNSPRRYYGLTTGLEKYKVNFNQYGLHEISMLGSVDDIFGNSYKGGGTYEVYVARHLDIETGVFPNTPFEVGDSYSPTVIIQPGVAADVTIRIQHYPNSDPEQLIEHQIEGRANRFGYFHPSSHQAVIFENPGEYRADIQVMYTDEQGVLWMGAETWATIVETPNSPIIAHGFRNNDEQGGRQQWLLASETNISGTHLPFPYHSGDIAWSMDTFVDEFFTAMVPGITVQDTEGTYADIAKSRTKPLDWFSRDIDELNSIGQIPLFVSSPKGIPPSYLPDEPETYWGYFYSGAARPGIRVRDMVSEFENQESYWRFEDPYNYQPGNGVNGDEPNDFKFMFGGSVIRAPDIDYYNYAAYGSLWVELPFDDPVGTRLMPPFQGNGGGPTGGPIMTLLGNEIDIFFHPGGIRPGSILEVGDVASFAGQVAPTLPAKVWIRVTSPSGNKITINSQANKIGYFYQPGTDFVIDEPGVYEVNVNVAYEGRTSAGQVQQPYPEGSVLGTTAGKFEFYVVEPTSTTLTVDIPEKSWVEPGNGPIDIDVLQTDELDDVRLHYTTVMPGVMMEQGSTNNPTYRYDAPELHKDFPNLDLFDRDARTGVDTITMSFLVSGTNGEGETEYRARQVLLQGEELLAPAQKATAVAINAGFNDAWRNPEKKGGQGVFVVVFPDIEFIFLAWFTYDLTQPAGDIDYTVGHPSQRWYTAFGPYNGDTAVLDLELNSNGIFDSAAAFNQVTDGTVTLKAINCEEMLLSYNIESADVSGDIPLGRIVDDNVPYCNSLAGGEMAGAPDTQPTILVNKTSSEQIKAAMAGTEINAGFNDAWRNPEKKGGQGVFAVVFPIIKSIFMAWFTYDTENPDEDIDYTIGHPSQRWYTAFGGYDGDTAVLNLELNSGGTFDSASPFNQVTDGSVTLKSVDCEEMLLEYDIFSADLQGEIPLERIVGDNVPYCMSLAGEGE